MYLKLVNSDGSKIDLLSNEYFNIVDADGFTEGNTSISSSTLADTDGDTINAQMINARDITLTIRFKDGVSPELGKRYMMRYFKLKKTATLELDYKDRISRLTGYVQSIDMPRFTSGVTAQISLHCSSPFWQDVESLSQMVSNVIAMHHWPIMPTAEEPIIMGVITDVYQALITNDGDADIGMLITILAERPFSNPRIILNGKFFEVGISMEKGQELVINTNKGQKSVTLEGVSVINKITTGSTWLQLEIGENAIVATNSLNGDGMNVNISANERYI